MCDGHGRCDGKNLDENNSQDSSLSCRALKGLSLGLRPGVELVEGAVCEFLLSFLSCLVIMSSLGALLTVSNTHELQTIRSHLPWLVQYETFPDSNTGIQSKVKMLTVQLGATVLLVRTSRFPPHLTPPRGDAAIANVSAPRRLAMNALQDVVS